MDGLNSTYAGNPVEPLTLEKIKEAQRILDSEEVPTKDRIVFNPLTGLFHRLGKPGVSWSEL